MMSAGLPVFANLDLSDYGLKNLKHFVEFLIKIGDYLSISIMMISNF